jgi:uncharacterized repeat protein (TIGR03803 family)
MRTSVSFLLSSCAASILLAGCSALRQAQGDTQPPNAALGLIPQASSLAARSDSTSYKVVYSFSGAPDGQNPQAGLIDVGGTLYGTTAYGGTNDYSSLGAGTVFRVTASGTEKVLHDFGAKGDGTWPFAGLIEVGGVLYGTTYLGGSNDCPYRYSSAYYLCGTVFSITPSGAEKVLYNFGGGRGDRDGNHPVASVVDVKGTLYGTTQNGGPHHIKDRQGCGTVFSTTPSGAEKVLHSFSCGKDGGLPAASLIAVKGWLYGTTSGGGTYDGGTVFRITPSGKQKVLHSFGYGTDGSGPSAGLVAVSGTLYGTTSGGGTYGGGTVFSITPSGKETVVHSFGSGTDGADPLASLIDVKGTLYGTTQQGGANTTCNHSTSGCGTVFSIAPSGTENVLHSFGSGTDGIAPVAALVEVDGTLYGTTMGGGANERGTVFALKP